MTILIVIGVLLVIASLTITYYSHRHDREYENLSARDVLSPRMSHLLRAEQIENLEKKQKFERYLHESDTDLQSTASQVGADEDDGL
jgi:hypothetical protein